jgi:hypothetical protein
MNITESEWTEASRQQFARAYHSSRVILDCSDEPIRKLLTIHKGRTDAADMVSDHVRTVASVACSAGCSMCCHQTVGISASEACIIALYMRAKNPPHGNIRKIAKLVGALPPTEQYTRDPAL